MIEIPKGTRQPIIDFVSKNSYFEFDDYENGVLQFSTRENGSVSEELPGKKDIEEAKKLKKDVCSHFPSVDAQVETFDEWVFLSVKSSEKPESQFRYIFKKDMNGAGFSQSFDTMNMLIERYGDWIEVDWEEIKQKVDKINDFPKDTFVGWMNSYPLLIKRAGETGNTWGYNFYIIKSKKD